jgi:ankyrin repeat protein
MYDCVCVVQEGLTSLILAVQNKHVEIVESLLNANADPNITENVSNE